MKRKPLILIALSLAAVGLVSVGNASNNGGGENEKRTLAQAEKKQVCTDTHEAISFYRKATWRWQTSMGARPTAGSEIAPHACGYAKWVAKLWVKRSAKARDAYEKWISNRTIPVTNDWFNAVAISQRVFPRTAGWLLSCSKHEGGHGGFVMNHQGSGAGGWMQFMSSTYYGNADDARAYVKSRGFIVDSKVWSWSHPLGQALTAGYMRAVLGNSHVHWAPSIDPYCY